MDSTQSYSHNNNNENDDDLNAALRASLMSLQKDEQTRNKRQSFTETEDSDLAMALKLSQQMWESQLQTQTNTDTHHSVTNSHSNTTNTNDMSCDETHTNTKVHNIETDYQFSDDNDADFENDETNDAEFEDENESENEEFEDENDWGDAELVYDNLPRLEMKQDEEDGQAMMKRLKEKRRREQSKIEKFWKCGKCLFLNHPSRPICMMCHMPELDVVHHILQCPKNKLKICIKCQAYVVPHMYDNHLLDCKPLGAVDNAEKNQAWYVKLTACEQNAINHVNAVSIKKSTERKVLNQLLKKIGEIDSGLYAGQTSDVLQRLYEFMEWTVPIIIRLKGASLIPILLKDTHYRSLFEINPHYKKGGYNRNDARCIAEEKMFGPVYNKATVFERPKYGCLNVGLRPEGCLKAMGYGDCYFLMNDATVRWRTTLTIMDSFSVNGNCGTVKHCNHLLIQLNNNELKELIEAALYATKGGMQQSTYREIQIHGPVQLNRDVLSFHVPNTPQHKKNEKMYRKFCARNMCKLVYFDVKNNNQFHQYGY